MISLLEFKLQKCDFAVLECGIGGHLDATNIVDFPVCSAITSIGLDHIDVIGNTIEAIASEKAGVIKTYVPCVIGPTCLNLKPIEERASKQQS
jgi:dihydrofolate synthase/folylpolyglutamate synthase